MKRKKLFTLDVLKPVLEQHPVREHHFLRAFANGEFDYSQVQSWAREQYHFSVSLPRCFAALYARISDQYWKEKRPLIDLLSVEAWGTEKDGGHSRHFMSLLEFLGLDGNELSRTVPKQYTEKYLEERLIVCLSHERPIGVGLATIALGNELLNLTLFRAYRTGIPKIHGLEHCPTSYFDAHLKDESEDYKVFAELFEKVIHSEQELIAAGKNLKNLLDKRVIFFDSLYRDLKENV